MTTYSQISTQDPEGFVYETANGVVSTTLDSILGIDSGPMLFEPDPSGFDLVQATESLAYVPEVFLDADGDLSVSGDERWTPVTGFSGQHGYPGPVMHASEFIGGSMAQHIVDNPGIYVAVVVDALDEHGEQEDEPAGWMLLRRDA